MIQANWNFFYWNLKNIFSSFSMQVIFNNCKKTAILDSCHIIRKVSFDPFGSLGLLQDRPQLLLNIGFMDCKVFTEKKSYSNLRTGILLFYYWHGTRFFLVLDFYIKFNGDFNGKPKNIWYTYPCQWREYIYVFFFRCRS